MTDQVQMSESEKKKEDWMNAKWRPMMGWMYMLVCTMDFVVFPVLWSILHAILKDGNVQQWQPLTLQGAGLFHMAMGAIIGVAAFGRTQEKLAGKANDNSAGFSAPTPSFSPAPSTPAPSFGGNSANTAPAFTPAPAPAFGSAPATPAVGKFGKVVPDADQPAL
jgi:hypothetical protein